MKCLRISYQRSWLPPKKFSSLSFMTSRRSLIEQHALRGIIKQKSYPSLLKVSICLMEVELIENVHGPHLFGTGQAGESTLPVLMPYQSSATSQEEAFWCAQLHSLVFLNDHSHWISTRQVFVYFCLCFSHQEIFESNSEFIKSVESVHQKTFLKELPDRSGWVRVIHTDPPVESRQKMSNGSRCTILRKEFLKNMWKRQEIRA